MTFLPYYAAMRISAKIYILLAVCGAACTLVTGFSSPASANKWGTLGKEGWIPSVSVFGGATIQDQEAAGDSACDNGGPGFPGPPGRVRVTQRTQPFAPCIFIEQPDLALPNPPPSVPPEDFPWTAGELRPAIRGNDWSVSPILGFDLQLLTPALSALPGKPRLFARGEIQLTFGSTRNVANEGNATGAHLNETIDSLSNIDTNGLSGTGSRVISETRTLGFGAVAGIAFPFEFLGRRLWLKPGAAWTRYTVDVVGKVEAGVKNDPQFVTTASSDWGAHLRAVSLSGKRSPTYNGIGPSLELEMDVGQFGPLGASLFLGGAVYKILGDRSVSFSDSVHFAEFNPGAQDPPNARVLPEDTYTANWTFEVDPWLVRGAVGFRLHWYGF